MGLAGDGHSPACGLARVCRGQAVRQLECGAGEVCGRNDAAIHRRHSVLLDFRTLNALGQLEHINGDGLNRRVGVPHLNIVLDILERVRLGHGVRRFGHQHTLAALCKSFNRDLLANILGCERVRFRGGALDLVILVVAAIPLVGQRGTSGFDLGDVHRQGLAVPGLALDGDGALQFGLFGRDGLCGLTVVEAEGKPLPFHPNEGVSAHRPGGPLADKRIAAPLGQE